MPGTSEQAQAVMDSFPPFYERTEEATRRTHERLDVLQVNVGRLCNLACRHCHMDAGPARTEVMARETLQQCLDVAAGRGFKTLDLTGGAPEMNPDFEWLIREGAARGLDIIVRSNLVVLLDEPYSGLDPHAMHIFDELIASVRENRTFVMVSHDLDKGLALASHVLVLARGRVVHFGEKDQMSPDEFADLYRTTVGMGVS